MTPLTIVGAGRAAWAFASIWKRGGRPLGAVLTRGTSPVPFSSDLGMELRPLEPSSVAGADLLFFALADGAIAPVYAMLRPAIAPDATLFHASGSLPSDLFEHDHRFSLHPLCSLPPPGTSSVDLRGVLMTWEGAPETRSLAEQMASMAGGEFRAIETRDKALYHAAAVFGANYVSVALEAANRLMGAAGVDRAESALRHLAESAIRNWAEAEGSGRFTGPAARGDAAVIRAHLQALASHPLHDDAYRALGSLLLATLASTPGAPDLHEIRTLLARKDPP